MMPTSRTIPTAPNGEPPTDGACIHELFEAEAARAPEACAVVLGQESITYGETILTYDGSLKHLKELTKLKDLKLTKTDVPAADLERLTTDVPGVKIDHTPPELKMLEQMRKTLEKR